MVREVLESGAELLDADVAAYAVRDGEVVVVKAFHDRHGFSAPDATAAESVVAVLRERAARDRRHRDRRRRRPAGAGRSRLRLRTGADRTGPPPARRRPHRGRLSAFARADSFGDDDGRLATTLAAQLALTLRNVRAFQREHEIAETFQQALLVEPPLLAGAEIGVQLPGGGARGARRRRLLRHPAARSRARADRRGRRLRPRAAGRRRDRAGALHAARLRAGELARARPSRA